MRLCHHHSKSKKERAAMKADANECNKRSLLPPLLITVASKLTIHDHWDGVLAEKFQVLCSNLHIGLQFNIANDGIKCNTDIRVAHHDPMEVGQNHRERLGFLKEHATWEQVVEHRSKDILSERTPNHVGGMLQ
jgi:hypothetical protein